MVGCQPGWHRSLIIGAAGPLDTSHLLASTMTDYYLTNPIARASATMAECSREFVTGASKMAAE